MPIPVNCPHCSQKLEAPDKLSGKRVKCPKCKGAVEIPFLLRDDIVAEEDELKLAPLDDAAPSQLEIVTPVSTPPDAPDVGPDEMDSVTLDSLGPPSEMSRNQPASKAKKSATSQSKPTAGKGRVQAATGPADDDLNELQLAPGPNEFSLGDELEPAEHSAAPASLAVPSAGATTLGAKTARANKSASGRDAATFLAQKWLGVLVGVVALVVLITLCMMGHYIIGPVLGLIGAAIATREILADKRTERFAQRKQENALGGIAGGLSGLFIALMIVGRIIRGIARSNEGAADWLFPVAMIVGGIIVLLAIVLAAAKLSLRFGVLNIIAGGYLCVALLLTLALSMLDLDFSGMNADAAATVTFTEDYRTLPLPGFPDRGEPRAKPGGVQLHSVSLQVPAKQPGSSSRVYVYLPPGEHTDKSLGCVFIAPAGATSFTGMGLGLGDSPEHLPYALAGYAVVAYEVDGEHVDDDRRTDRERAKRFIAAYHAHRAAHAGLVNARNAIEYVLAKFPEIDPQRLAVAGHSSAGRVALVVAANEPRIKACIAYAPDSDFEEAAKELDSQLSDATEYFRSFSPVACAAKIRCPVFLFHARDDTVIAYQDSEKLAGLLKQAGTRVHYQVVATGDHHASMIREGVPGAISWLNSTIGPGTKTPPSRRDGPPTDTVAQETPVVPATPEQEPEEASGTVASKTSTNGENDPAEQKQPDNGFPGDATSLVTGPASGSRREIELANRAYMQQVYVDLISDDGSQLKEQLRWYPRAKQPAIGLRWGIGVTAVGKTSQPTINSLGDFQQLAGAIGMAIAQGIEQRKVEGAFGDLPTSSEPRAERMMMDSGTAVELRATARRRELDCLILISLQTRRALSGKVTDSIMQVEISDVKNRQAAWSSSDISRRELETAQKEGRDPVTNFVANVFQQIDQNYRLQPMPNITAPIAARRAASLVSKSTRDWRPVLMELRYYQTQGLLPAPEAAAHYEKILGAANGKALLDGDIDARQKALSDWFEQKDK